MDPITQELFGDFPRVFGTPNQWVIHSMGEMEIAIEHNDGKRNCYSSISSAAMNGGAISDKVSFDFDSPHKDTAFYDVEGDHIKIQMMRDDPDLADEVLGEVCEEASILARECKKNDIPLLGVYTGFGIHAHMLFEPEPNPVDAMGSTAWKCIEELNLQTTDNVINGDVKRIMRVPNCERVHVEGIGKEAIRKPCGLHTIPLTAQDMIDCTPTELLEMSKEKRRIEVPDMPERSEMRVFDEYVDKAREERQQVDLDVSFDDFEDDEYMYFIRELLKMPCMAEHVIQPNPRHDIRRNLAVMLFNLGFDKSEAMELIKRLQWRDFNPNITRAHLDNIYKNGYGDMSCRTMQKAGFCVHKENPKECRTFGWSGGNPEWKE